MTEKIACLLNESDTEVIMNTITDTVLPFFKQTTMKSCGIKISVDTSNSLHFPDIVISFVGELYNLDELVGLALSQSNKDYKPISPEELIVDLYKKHGFDYMIQLLDGKFAMILFDYNYIDEISKVYIARDSLGLIPLYMFKRSLPFTLVESYGFFTEKHPFIFVDDFVEITPGTYQVYTLPFKVSAHWSLSNTVTYYNLPSTTITGRMDLYYWNQIMTNMVYESIKKRLWCYNGEEIVYLMTGICECDNIVLRGLRKFFKNFVSIDRELNSAQDRDNFNIHTYFIRKHHSNNFQNIKESLKILKTTHTDIFMSDGGDLLSVLSKKYTNHNSAIFLYSDGFSELVGYDKTIPDIFEYDKTCRNGLKTVRKYDNLYNTHSLFLDKKLLESFLNIPLVLREKHREHLFEYVKI